MRKPKSNWIPARSRLRPGNWPVRWRLTAVSAGLTLVILLIFGAVIGNLAARQIRSDFNRELENAVSTLAAQVRIIDTPTETLITQEPHLGDFVSQAKHLGHGDLSVLVLPYPLEARPDTELLAISAEYYPQALELLGVRP